MVLDRQAAASCYHCGNDMSACAGYDMDELYMLDLKTHTWELIVPKGSKPSARYLHTAVVIKDAMVIFGGNDKDCGDVWSFSFKSRRWSQLSKVAYAPSNERPLPTRQIQTLLVFHFHLHLPCRGCPVSVHRHKRQWVCCVKLLRCMCQSLVCAGCANVSRRAREHLCTLCSCSS